jgi:multicomponent K+:H+ antiporter subunit D
MPPLSGFVGKLLILDAVRADDTMWLIWTVVLVGSLFAILGFAQAGSRVFWKTEAGEAPDPDTALPDPGDLKPLALPATATSALLGAIIALTIFAGPTTRYLEATAVQLYTPKNYIDAVYGQEPVAAPYPGAKPTPNRILAPKNGPGAGTETPKSKGDG